MKEYPLFKVHVGNVDRVLERIRAVLESGFINEGEQVSKLSHSFSQALRAPNLLLVNSCTSALTMALRLAGVVPGSKVISTSMTCLATNCPIVNAGAQVVWADIDQLTGCINPAEVEALIVKTSPKAVIAVAWAGIPPDMRLLREICRDTGVRLILDAAHAMKATYLGKPIHEWADFTCYSLQAIKHITTGDGGILVCNDTAEFQRAKRLKWFGIDRDEAKDEKGDWRGQHWEHDVMEAGYKFNMNNLSAALGLEQLEHLDSIIHSHRRNAAAYAEIFETSRYVVPLRSTIGSTHWVYTVRLKSGKELHRDKVLRLLNDEGIKAGVVHVPNHRYDCFDTADLPQTDAFARSQFSLPVGWWLGEDDVKHIGSRVESICASVAREQ